MIPPLRVPPPEAPHRLDPVKRSFGLALGLWLLAAPFAWAQSPTVDSTESRRIVAIGDIHGAYDNFVALLETAELIDRRQRWSGGDAILVQTGDFIDRGAGSVQVARLLERLQEQSARDGGEVIVLLGNHEVLNLIGDLRYDFDETIGWAEVTIPPEGTSCPENLPNWTPPRADWLEH